MPNVQPSVDVFTAEIKLLEESFERDLKKLTVKLKKMTDTELIQATSQLNFFQEIVDKGYGSALDKFDGEYTKMLATAVKEARKRGIDPLAGASVEGLQVLRDMDYERLLGRASFYASELQAQLFRGVYGGSSISQIASSLSGTSLASHQLNVMAYDGLKIFDDMSRYAVFKGEDVEWTYIGPQDGFTRDVCKSTKANEPKDGYTESGVSSSETPFGTRGGFNCRHSWEIK
tara:strand:+ start:11264 stop:11956 length:693 start_codon:yes stop_codon:yes gene_type:complete